MSVHQSPFTVIARARQARGYTPAMIELHQAYLGVRKRLYERAKPPVALPKPVKIVVVSPFIREQRGAPVPDQPPILSAAYAEAHEIADQLAAGIPLAKRLPTVALIKHILATEFGVRVADIDSSRRTAEVVRPRMIGMYLAREMRPDSLPTIGRKFGDRDHTTALNACNKIGARVAADPEFAALIDGLKAKIEARA